LLTRAQIDEAREYALAALAGAGVVVRDDEAAELEVSDFGLGDLARIGLQILVYVNTDRVCAKELVMMPGQICPEHVHVGVGGQPGKEETFRVRTGEVILHVDDEERVLMPGDQHTIMPGTRHWFQAGSDGAIVTEFSTRSTDELDVFTDPDIRRITVVAD
jgi:D-lyxose ketol-isomerase